MARSKTLVGLLRPRATALGLLIATGATVVAGPGATSALAGRCTTEVKAFLEQWRALHPEEAGALTQSTEAAQARLQKFYGGAEPGPTYEGAEGTVHTSPLNPGRAIKVWKPAQMGLFNDAVDFLVAARNKVAKMANISDKFRVVQVFERGNGWISREFVEASRPLTEAIQTDEAALKAGMDLRKVALAEAARTKDPILKRLASMLDKGSPNLHWDPATKQIVMIDGF